MLAAAPEAAAGRDVPLSGWQRPNAAYLNEQKRTSLRQKAVEAKVRGCRDVSPTPHRSISSPGYD